MAFVGPDQTDRRRKTFSFSTMVDVPRSQDTTWHFTPDKVSPDIWHLILGELAENAQGCEILPLLHVCKAWNVSHFLAFFSCISSQPMHV